MVEAASVVEAPVWVGVGADTDEVLDGVFDEDPVPDVSMNM